MQKSSIEKNRKMIIRKLKPNDFLQVFKISNETLPEQYNPDVFIKIYQAFPNGLWVAEKNREIIGFIIGAKTKKDAATILIISVSKKYQRKGIGSSLLKKFLMEMTIQKVKKVELQVRTNNTRALTFYKKHGFKVIKKLQNFYQQNKDGYSMIKKII